MNKPYYLIICIAIAFGCGDKDKFLFTAAQTDLVVNPETKVLVKDNVLLYTRLDSGNIIRGYTNINAFSTDNQFKTFTYNGITLPTTITPYSIDKNKIATASGDVLSPELRYSEDYGSTWTSFTPTLTPELSTAGYYSTELVSVNFIDKDNFLMMYVQKSTSSADKRSLYRVNAHTQVGVRVSSFQDAWIPVSMKFADVRTGWMLMYNSGAYGTSYISKTVDSGITWTSPKIIDSKITSVLELGSNGILTVHHPMGNAAFSADSGLTWKKPQGGTRFTCLHRVNADVVYGISDASLMKSTDGGQTWEIVANTGYEFGSMKNIYFQDEENGLMYADQKLFITADGGKSWKALLYPFSYIIQ